MEKGKTAPSEIVSCAEGKVEGFKSLKNIIDSDLMSIHEKIEGIKTKIKDNIKNNQKPEGLLTRNEQDYLRCL